MMYVQGDIVTVPFPFTDQRGSTLRPALVISGSLLNVTDDILLVQITKNNRSDDFSVPLTKSDLTVPLKYTSEIRCHKLLIADRYLINKKISSATPELVQRVKAKIIDILNP